MDRNTQLCIEQIRDVLDEAKITNGNWQAIKPELGSKPHFERNVGRRHYDGEVIPVSQHPYVGSWVKRSGRRESDGTERKDRRSHNG